MKIVDAYDCFCPAWRKTSSLNNMLLVSRTGADHETISRSHNELSTALKHTAERNENRTPYRRKWSRKFRHHGRGDIYTFYTCVCTNTQARAAHGFRTMTGPCRAGRMPRGTPKAIHNTNICACTPIHGTHVSTWTFF